MHQKDRDPPGQVHDGEFVPIPRAGEYIACCDCGLTHLVKIVCDQAKQPGLRFWRSPRQTRVMRATMRQERQRKHK